MARRSISGAVAAAVLLVSGHGAEAAKDSLLRLEGRQVKWGGAAWGAAAVVTYAYLERSRTFPGSINCTAMDPVDGLLARSGIDRGAFEKEIQAAFRLWSDVANVTFARVDDAESANIVIGAQADTRGVAYTNIFQARTPGGGIDGIARAQVCFSPGVAWELGIDGDSETYNVRYVATHEIGHAIGLDHPGRRGAVMAYEYREKPGDTVDLRLAPSDVVAIVKLYGPRSRYARPVVDAAASARPAAPAERWSITPAAEHRHDHAKAPRPAAGVPGPQP